MEYEQQQQQEQHHHPQGKDEKEEEDSHMMFYSTERNKPHRQHQAKPASEPLHPDPIVAEAIHEADRRENTRLRKEIVDINSELETWKERAQQAFASLEQKVEFSVVGAPDSRRALANALVEIEGLKRRMEKQQRQLHSAQSSLEEERQVRRGLQRDLEALRGNIRVIVRVRGGLAQQQQDPQKKPMQFHGDGNMVMVNRGVLKPRGEFDFFKVLPPETSQSNLFAEQVAPLVDMAVQTRRSLSILAYGQTSAGKTFTCFGRQEGTSSASGSMITSETGIALRTAKLLLDLTCTTSNGNDADSAAMEFDVGISCIELYCDELRDLLQTKSASSSSCSSSPGAGSLSSSSAATVAVVRTLKEAAAIIQRGADRRWTEATQSNITSSRSHCLITFHVVARGGGGQGAAAAAPRFRIVLADLAGSERLARSGSNGQRLLEAQFINKSLSALGDVVHALSAKKQQQQQQPFVPFRNSSLTMLLQDSISGSATTIFLACVANEEKEAEETYSTLSFASRVRSVKNVQFCRGEIKGALSRMEEHQHQQPQQQAFESSSSSSLQQLQSSPAPSCRALKPIVNNSNTGSVAASMMSNSGDDMKGGRSASSCSSSSCSSVVAHQKSGKNASMGNSNNNNFTVTSSRSTSAQKARPRKHSPSVSCPSQKEKSKQPAQDKEPHPEREQPEEKPVRRRLPPAYSHSNIMDVDAPIPTARLSLSNASSAAASRSNSRSAALPEPQQQSAEDGSAVLHESSAHEAARLRSLLIRKRSPKLVKL